MGTLILSKPHIHDKMLTAVLSYYMDNKCTIWNLRWQYEQCHMLYLFDNLTRNKYQTPSKDDT